MIFEEPKYFISFKRNKERNTYLTFAARFASIIAQHMVDPEIRVEQVKKLLNEKEYKKNKNVTLYMIIAMLTILYEVSKNYYDFILSNRSRFVANVFFSHLFTIAIAEFRSSTQPIDLMASFYISTTWYLHATNVNINDIYQTTHDIIFRSYLKNDELDIFIKSFLYTMTGIDITFLNIQSMEFPEEEMITNNLEKTIKEVKEKQTTAKISKDKLH